MSYKPPMFRATADADGWTTVQPKLTRSAFDSKPDAPVAKAAYKPPAQRGPNKKPEANTFDEAFPELGPTKAQPLPSTPPTASSELKKPMKSLADLFKPSQSSTPADRSPQHVPVVRTLSDVP